MRRTVIIIILLLALAFSGCANLSSSDLFTLPEVSLEHAQLIKLIKETTSSGYWQNASPQSGDNRYTMQFVDIYGDGISEAVTFFKSKQETMLRVGVYSKTGSSSYTMMCKLDMAGSFIDSISYRDLNGDGSLEFIIKAGSESSSLCSVNVFAIKNNVPVCLMEKACTDMVVYDMTLDGMPDILCVNNSDNPEGAYAELFTYDTVSENKQLDTLISLGSANLISGMSKPEKITAGMLNEDTSAVVLDGRITGAESKVIYTADIISYNPDTGLINLCQKTEALSNMTQADFSFYSARAVQTYCADVNFDGFIEFPVPVNFTVTENYSTLPGPFLRWYGYQNTGMIFKVDTFSDSSSKWYFIFPLSWSSLFYMQEENKAGGYVCYEFFAEKNSALRSVLTIYVYPTDDASEITPEKDAFFLTTKNGYTYYAKIPNASKSILPAELLLTGTAEVKQRFVTVDTYGNVRRVTVK